MPMTLPGKRDLEAIYREDADFARQHDGIPYNKIPLDELEAQRQRDKRRPSLEWEAMTPVERMRSNLESRDGGGSLIPEEERVLAELRMFSRAVKWDSRASGKFERAA